MCISAVTVIALLWAGMILGISFLESWVKFRASSLTKPVALDVGKTVFGAFQWVQLVLLALMITLAVIYSAGIYHWMLIVVVGVALLAQIFYFFPKLAKRVKRILAGETPEPSKAHLVYGLIELGKLVLLIAFIV